MTDADIAGLVAARICHDLANPLGAIGNGIDLMRELGEAAAEDMVIVAEAQVRAVALIGFHRLALGAAAMDSARVERREIAARCEAALTTPHLSLSWTAEDFGSITRPAARLTALMVLAARSLAGRSGKIETAFNPASCTPITVLASGEGVRWDEAWKTILMNESASVEARNVEFALLPRAARAAGCRLEIIDEPGRGGLRAS